MKRWRCDVRPGAVRDAVRITRFVSWSPTLLEALMEELYIGDGLEMLLGERLRDLPPPQYAQAVALALILRHSWRGDDLAWMLERLGLTKESSPRRRVYTGRPAPRPRR